MQAGISAICGTREEQQDAILEYCGKSYGIAAVFDGMGGLEMGAAASRLAVEILEEDFIAFDPQEDLVAFLREEFYKIDEAIHQMKDTDGKQIDAGTTAVAVAFRNDEMYWISAGDSKLFFIREDEIYSVTREHNYLLSLDILKAHRKISEEQYQKEYEKGEALISYLGIGNLRLLDQNEEPFMLQKGDCMLLCSDGVYKKMLPQEIKRIVLEYETAQEAASALTDSIVQKREASQDNASVVLLKY